MSALLLELPVEIWDRVLFWMSLLPIDVANFAKASVLCHYLAFGPVGDRNEHNVLQHRALAPITCDSQLDSAEKWHAALVRASKMSPSWRRAKFGKHIHDECKTHFMVLMRATLSAQQVALLARLLGTLDQDQQDVDLIYDRVVAMRIKCGLEEHPIPYSAPDTRVYYCLRPLIIAAMVAESRFDWLGRIELEHLNFPIREAMRSGNAEVLRWLLDRSHELAGGVRLDGNPVDLQLLLLQNNPGLTPEVFATTMEWFGERVARDRLWSQVRTVFPQLQSPEGQPFLDAVAPVLQQSDELQHDFAQLITATPQYVCWWWVCYAVEHDLKMSFPAVMRGMHVGCELLRVAADAGAEEERARASRVIFHLTFRTRLVGTPRGFARSACIRLRHLVDDPEEFDRAAEFMFDGEAVAPIHTVLRMLLSQIEDAPDEGREAHTSTVINGLKPYL